MGMALSVVLLAVLAASLFYIVRAEGGIGEIPRILKRVGIEVPTNWLPANLIPSYTPSPTASTPAKIPAEFQSGTSRFSQGSCASDLDCFRTGCSGEACSNDPNTVTTCEFSASFPGQQGYSCDCLSTKVCGWK